MSSPSGDWPEPIVRVQSLSDTCTRTIPERYVKPVSARPSLVNTTTDHVNIPLIDLGELYNNNNNKNINSNGFSESILKNVSDACRDWGFFQVINHGVRPELMDRAWEIWAEFFHQPMEVKQAYANSPTTYVGYGSRLGVDKGAVLDWSDYYFLHYLPCHLRDFNKWPALPQSLREVLAEYSAQVVRLGGVLLKIMSINLGLSEDLLQNAFGGDDIGACLRVNFYPKCPQPDLTFGLSPHSDPGGMTLLLTDPNVPGLQVRRAEDWITVKPAPHAFIVNIGDQIQVLSNAIYKSVEHRVIVNAAKERISLAFFYNPKSDLLIQPIKELVKLPDRPPLYTPMTFDEYRLYIRTKGPKGKSQLGESSDPPK